MPSKKDPLWDDQAGGMPMEEISTVQKEAPEQAKKTYIIQESTQPIIRQEDVEKAASILQEYKSGKANLESRVVEDELWWELRHWEAIR